MIITKTVKVRKTVVETELVDCLCNKCGESYFAPGIGDFGLHYFKISNGFGDKYDGQLHIFHLCDRCYIKMIKRFKLFPSSEEKFYD